MAKKASVWKKGAGKLGVMAPLLGVWEARTDSPMGPLRCTREFTKVLGGKYIELKARWHMPKGVYEETAIYGVREGRLGFWSFTSDGKRSEGDLANGKDVHADAIAFEAQMPAGLARMIYWPDGEGGFHWAVEAKNAKGWKRFAQHHYRQSTL